MFFHFFTESLNGCLQAASVKLPCKAIYLRGAQTFPPLKRGNRGGGEAAGRCAGTSPNEAAIAHTAWLRPDRTGTRAPPQVQTETLRQSCDTHGGTPGGARQEPDLALTSRGACSQLFTGLRSVASNQQFPHQTAAKCESDRHSQGGRYRPKRFSFTSSTSRLKSNKTAAGAKLHTPVKGGGGGSKRPTAPYVPDVNDIPIKRRGNYSIETLGAKPAQNIPNGPQKCNLQLFVT